MCLHVTEIKVTYFSIQFSRVIEVPQPQVPTPAYFRVSFFLLGPPHFVALNFGANHSGYHCHLKAFDHSITTYSCCIWIQLIVVFTIEQSGK